MNVIKFNHINQIDQIDHTNRIDRVNSVITSFSGKKIAVYGLGVSGIKTLELLTIIQKLLNDMGLPLMQIWVIDKKQNCYDPPEIESAKYIWVAEEDASQLLGEIDLIILAPGVPRQHPALRLATKLKVNIWSEIELAYQFIDPKLQKIIAVTGSNGKTTTVTIIGEILKNLNFCKFFVGGNIGVPFCQWAINHLRSMQMEALEVIVLELSSFQLESIVDFHPQIAILLNLAPTHQERYSSMEDYANAKFRITMNQGAQGVQGAKDLLIYRQGHPLIDKWIQQQERQENQGHNGGAVVRSAFDEEIAIKEIAKYFSLERFRLPGKHNLENLFCAYQAVMAISSSLDFGAAAAHNTPNISKCVQQTIDSFRGVHYRIEELENGSRYRYLIFNDAK
ncbi:MAG: hypothetical protein HQK53_13885, partial [Oligoflexia bacterium]|nr:hypothetical protein [Oligoflexia bacterium]